MMKEPIVFSDLLLETKDGEWGEGQEAPGHILCDVIRGTDFADLHSPAIELPQRWIPEHLVERKALKSGDILIETAGGTAKQSTGRTALITEEFMASRGERPVLCSSFARHLRVDRAKVHPVYLYYVLQALYASGYMGVFNLQHTGVSRFQFTAFRTKTRLRLHDDKAQPKIAAILAAYDDLIANNQSRIALLESMAEEIYREWFVRMRFPGCNTAQFSKGVPRDLKLLPLGHHCRVVKGKSYASEDLVDDESTIPFVTLKSFNRGGGYRAEGLKFYKGEFKSEQVVAQGDLVMAVTDMTQDRVVVGQSARVPNLGDRGAVISLDVIKLVPKDINATYLYLFLRFSGFANYIKEFANGANVLHLKPDLVPAQKVVFAPRGLQDRLALIVEPMLQQAEELNECCRKLTQIRDALLPRLISGKLRVDQLDIQYPPSMVAELAQAV